MTFVLTKFAVVFAFFFWFWFLGYKIHWPTFFVTLVTMAIGLELR